MPDSEIVSTIHITREKATEVYIAIQEMLNLPTISLLGKHLSLDRWQKEQSSKPIGMYWLRVVVGDSYHSTDFFASQMIVTAQSKVCPDEGLDSLDFVFVSRKTDSAHFILGLIPDACRENTIVEFSGDKPRMVSLSNYLRDLEPTPA